MLEYIKGVKNEAPFMYFEKISKIPRASGNERAMADYLVSFACQQGLFSYRDEFNNVLIVREASVGRENDAPVMLQAHTDMVAEKNVGTAHDFATDPIKLIQEGNILRADGTTLGGDDGFGVGVMMAVLADKSISVPYLECLFTSSEEIGLVGASKFDFSKIKSRRMVNLDSAEERCVITGCCGGVRSDFTLNTEFEIGSKKGVLLTLGGLCGGHSGEDIYKNRLNSNITLGGLIEEINAQIPVKIAYMSGGDKDNAIPRECCATIVPCNEADFEKLISACDLLGSTLAKKVVAEEDNGAYIKAEKTEANSCLSKEDTEKVLEILRTPNGVLKYREDIPVLPRISRNLARVRTNENGISVGFSSRAVWESELDERISELDTLAQKIGATVYHHERYPGWESDINSHLVKSWQSSAKRVMGIDVMAIPIHAGLECGLISKKLNNEIEAISVGCNVHDLHTPKETLELDSMDKIYDTVVDFLKN